MERKHKKALEAYFEAPEPERKTYFLRKYSRTEIDMLHMIATQVHYISKWIWVISVLFCIVAFVITRHIEIKYVSTIFALIPFLVLLSVTETTRSYRYEMEELELSARFSLKSIVLARMIILGIGNMAVLIMAAVFIGNRMYGNILYMMVPYFLTAAGGLYLLRKIRGMEGTAACCAFSVIISGMETFVSWKHSILYTRQYISLWLLVCVFGLMLMMREGYRAIRMTEDLVWN